MVQIHKKFTDDQVKDLFARYLQKKIQRKYIQEILGIVKARFFALLKQYRNNPNNFSIQYIRKSKTRSIDPRIEEPIFYCPPSTILNFSRFHCPFPSTTFAPSPPFCRMRLRRFGLIPFTVSGFLHFGRVEYWRSCLRLSLAVSAVSGYVPA